ncbi:MAG: hypothetical protein IH586_06245, partial [Anaerolineaceae bacterium]|nr:hypothetical protein [Anaerolineaceae bacterium]
MNSAKLSLPFPTYTGPTQPALKQALGGCTTLFSAPAGYVPTSRLSGLLQEQQARVIWLRAGSEDGDPATFLISLANGAEGIFPGVGRCTLERMRESPGPVFGWAPLFSGLARDIGEAADGKPNLTLVIQHLGSLYTAPQTLAQLHDIFLPLLPVGISVILISHFPPARGTLPGYIVQITTRDLRMDEVGGLLLAENTIREGGFAAPDKAFLPAPSLPMASLRRMVALVEGCSSALIGLGTAYSWLGGSTFRQVIEAASGRVDLLARVARLCLQSNQQSLDELLSLALCLGYLHPDLTQSAPGLQAFISDHL